MKYLAIFLFIGSLSAVKSQSSFKYSLRLISAKDESEWPMKAELDVEASSPFKSQLALKKVGANIDNIKCFLINSAETGSCEYDKLGERLNIANVKNATRLQLKYTINKTSQLEFWKNMNTPSIGKILAGNLAGEKSEVLLVEISGKGEFTVRLDGKSVFTWRNANNVEDLVFLGGDIETNANLKTKIYYAKVVFVKAVTIVTDFVKGFEEITGKGIEPGLLFVPNSISLTGLQKVSDFAEGLEKEESTKFSKGYLAFVKQLIRNGLGNSGGSAWWREAFVNYLSYYIISKYNKDFGSVWYDRFLLDVFQNEALEMDGFKSSVPLQDVPLPGKGASLMHSLWSICGDKKFHDGIKQCFVKAAVPDTLGEAFKKCFDSPEVATNFFKKYVEQPGYPVLHVEKTEKGYKLHQEQYFWSMENKTDALWTFPVSYKLQSEEVKWLSGKTLDLEVANSSEVLLFNSGYKGYYRVNYPEKVWSAMINYMKQKNDSVPSTRAQIINDLFSFSKSTFKFSHPVPDYRSALKLVSYLKDEVDYLPVKAAFNAFEFLESSLGGELNSRFKDFVRDIVKDLYNKFPLNGTSNELMRREVGFWACRLDIKSCVKDAKNILETIKPKFLISSPSSIAGFSSFFDYEVPLCVGIRVGQDDLWTSLFKTLGYIKNNPIFPAYVRVLGCTKNDTCLRSLIKETEEVSQSDIVDEVSLSILGGNPENVNTVLRYLIDNAEKNRKPFHERIARLALSKANKNNLHLFMELGKKWNIESILREFKEVIEYTNQWNNMKLSFIRDSLPSGESKTTPIALIVLFSAILPFLNSIFNN